MKQGIRSAWRFISEHPIISVVIALGVPGSLLANAIWEYGGDLRKTMFPPEPSGGTHYDDGFTPVSQGGTGYALFSGAVAAFERAGETAVTWSDSREHQLVYCRDFIETDSEELLFAFAEQFQGCLGVREMPGGHRLELRLVGEASRTYKLGEGNLRHHFCDCSPELIDAAIRNLQLVDAGAE